MLWEKTEIFINQIEMKRIITNLFVVVLLMLSATSWAQNEVKTIKVVPSSGTYDRKEWSARWESNENPKTVISVAGGINNMNSNATGDSFQFYVGQVSPSTWNISVPGCVIESYSFKFASVSNSVTITAGDKTMKSTSSSQTWSVNDVNALTASFQLSGGNNGINVTELTINVRDILEVGQVYMFKNARADRSLSADGADDVHTKATDATDTKQQWYVTKDGGYYVLRNLATAKYLKGNGMSNAWSMTNDYSHDYNKFELCASNTTYNTLHTYSLGDYAYMHDDDVDYFKAVNIAWGRISDGFWRNVGSFLVIGVISGIAVEVLKFLVNINNAVSAYDAAVVVFIYSVVYLLVTLVCDVVVGVIYFSGDDSKNDRYFHC